MAARSVFKLFTKTCSYSFNSASPSSPYSTVSANAKQRKVERQQRSYSQPTHLPKKFPQGRESFIQVRKVSRSLENLRESRYRDEEEEYEMDEERPSAHNYFPATADLNYRDPAKEFKEKYVADERNEEGNVIFEIGESSRTDENFFDVLGYMKNVEKNRSLKVFPHLQPSNIRPYGSNDNLYFPDLNNKKSFSIVYPVTDPTNAQQESKRKARVIPSQEYDSFEKNSPVVVEELNKKVAMREKSSKYQKDLIKMNYSTACMTARKIVPKVNTEKPPKLAVHTYVRKSGSNLLKKKKKKSEVEDVLETNRVGVLDQLYKRVSAYREMREAKKSRENFMKYDSKTDSFNESLLSKSKTNLEDRSRHFNTYSKPSSISKEEKIKPNEQLMGKSIHRLEDYGKRYNSYSILSSPRTEEKGIFIKEKNILTRSKSNLEDRSSCSNMFSNLSSGAKCEDYVTVKLGELQKECRQAKKCKPKKISFGRLPKMVPPDCPCIEDTPLKEGKPLLRLKKRFDVKEKRVMDCVEEVCDTPRADANYKIKRKALPQIKMEDCPCVEREFLDFKIKRLPKTKIPEPPRVCEVCVGEECCPKRSDDGVKVERKTLPKLSVNNCPCVENPPLKDVPLYRLKPTTIKAPPKVCPPPIECPSRADDNLKVKKKSLPILKSECICVEPPPPLDVPPLRRLKKVKIADPPRPVCITVTCDTPRADESLKPKLKKLPVLTPKPCPCIEATIPSGDVKLKRLKMRNIPKSKKEVCIVEECGGPRADDGMVIKPKKLPQIKPGECPCVEVVMQDTPPLKKLVPKPVAEPQRVCLKAETCPPRSDECLKVKKKQLPRMKPGNCPCIEPEPPLDVKPLPKLKRKEITEPERVCPPEEHCPERADENLKVQVKKLPKLKPPDCPCIEAAPPEDAAPLPRLRKVHIPDPPRPSPPEPCDDATRADEDDWLYWKRVEVKSPECEPNKKTKRSFSTAATAQYNVFHSKRFYGTKTKAEYDLFHLKYDIASLRTDQPKAKSYNVIIDIKPSAPLILTQAPVKLNFIEKSEDKNLALKRSKSEPVDCVTFIIYKSNSLASTKSKSGIVKDTNEGVNHLFSTINRFISTCSTLYDYSERTKEKIKFHQTPSCECPPNDGHLQPKNPIVAEKECFIELYPTNELIDNSIHKSRIYSKTRKTNTEEIRECEMEECKEQDDEKALCELEAKEDCPCPQPEKKLSLWEKVVNYFKARPDCPSPEEFKKMRLREDAEKAASKAGLCLYDPKEMLRKNEKELPKVITANKERK